MERIRQLVGRYPVLYSGQSFLSGHLGKNVDPVLQRCPLWLAKYGEPPKAVQATWPKWSLWQYTDGKYGPTQYPWRVGMYPRTTQGIGACDRSVFEGTPEEFRAWWRTSGST